MPPSPPARATSSRRRPSPSVSIVIPVRDTAGLPLTLRELPQADEVIVVTDVPETAAAVRAACPGALLVRPARAGVGHALACGFAASTGDIVVALDGAGSTDPAEIPRYVQALLAGADVALGTRYGEGGLDLTGGRFRRWANRLLIGLVNVLFGVRRTDPGFGYAAFRRAAIDRLDLPDPAVGAPAAWGDGPEFVALLTVRTAARGLSVAEVGSIAYPRLGRAARTDRTTLRHWLRAVAMEFPARDHSPPAARHAAVPAPGPMGRAGFPRRPPASRGAERRAPDATPPPAEPIWGPPDRSPAPPRDLWRADKSGPLERTPGHTPRGPFTDADPPRRDPFRQGLQRGARADDWLPDPVGRKDQVPDPREPEPDRIVPTRKPDERRRDRQRTDGRQGDQSRREVGGHRRRLDEYRQRPDLRVINGEGVNPGRTRSGRVRAVPRENLGG